MPANDAQPGTPVEALRRELWAIRDPGGGWKGAPEGAVSVEATALAIAALEASAAPGDPGLEDARSRLVQLQREDGGFPVGPDVPEPSWVTSIAGLLLRTDPATRNAAVGAARWLLENEGLRPGLVGRLRRRAFGFAGPVDVDVDVVGWGWLPNTFSWVEPTACAALLLRSLRAELGPRSIDERMEEVRALYADRECAGGGWNYGNRAVFDANLPPIPDSTAVALIGAQGWGSEPWVDRGFEALDRMAADAPSPLTYSLTRLARRLHSRPSAGVDAIEYQTRNTLLPQTRNYALAILAERRHPVFEL